MTRTISLVTLVFALVLGTVSTASAQSPSLRAPKKQAQGTPAPKVFDFDDDRVEGELRRPDGEGVIARPETRHSSLIEIRKAFVPEIVKSLEDL